MASSNSTSTPVPFPQPESIRNPNASTSPTASPTGTRRNRTSTGASIASNRIRTASLKLMEANPPPGMWAATGATASKAPSLADIRRGSFGSSGWDDETQRRRAGSRTIQEERARPTRRSSGTVSPPAVEGTEPFPAVTEEDMRERPSNEETRYIPKYDGLGKKVNDGVIELRQTNSLEDKTDGNTAPQPTTSSGEYANA